MPSPRKRIGYLPSEEVHDIIEKLCTANEFSQSKVTGLLVEEALRSRGVLNESFVPYSNIKNDFINFSFVKETFSKDKMIFFGIFLLVLIIYTLLVFSVKAAKILENIFTDSIDKTRIKEAAQANLFCAS